VNRSTLGRQAGSIRRFQVKRWDWPAHEGRQTSPKSCPLDTGFDRAHYRLWQIGLGPRGELSDGTEVIVATALAASGQENEVVL